MCMSEWFYEVHHEAVGGISGGPEAFEVARRHSIITCNFSEHSNTSSDGHGTRRDEIWLFIRSARLAKEFIPRARAFGPGSREARDSVGHVMVNSSMCVGSRKSI
jgi:hypothetical protein